MATPNPCSYTSPLNNQTERPIKWSLSDMWQHPMLTGY